MNILKNDGFRRKLIDVRWHSFYKIYLPPCTMPPFAVETDLIDDLDPCASKVTSVFSIATKNIHDPIDKCNVNAALEREHVNPRFVEREIDHAFKVDHLFYYRPRVFRDDVLTAILNGKQSPSRDDPRIVTMYGHLDPATARMANQEMHWRGQTRAFDLECNGTIPVYNFCSCKIETKSIQVGKDGKIGRIPACIENTPNLESLFMDEMNIHKIENLDKLGNLKELYLVENHISKIENLGNLGNLKVLSLDWNNIKEIEGLDKLSNLEWLNIGSNDLSKIEGLDKLSNLEGLALDINHIMKIEGLGKLRKLKRLDLRVNRISPADCKKFKMKHHKMENINC